MEGSREGDTPKGKDLGSIKEGFVRVGLLSGEILVVLLLGAVCKDRLCGYWMALDECPLSGRARKS